MRIGLLYWGINILLNFAEIAWPEQEGEVIYKYMRMYLPIFLPLTLGAGLMLYGNRKTVQISHKNLERKSDQQRKLRDELLLTYTQQLRHPQEQLLELQESYLHNRGPEITMEELQAYGALCTRIRDLLERYKALEHCLTQPPPFVGRLPGAAMSLELRCLYLMRNYDIQMELKLRKTPDPVRIELLDLERLVEELVRNNRHHSPLARIRIKVFQFHGRFFFRFRNTGPGARIRRPETLFPENFGRNSGPGLGILLMDAIARLSRGKLVITSGTTRGIEWNEFTIILPTC